MNRSTDQQLLRDYAGRQSESAFAELVRRHVDLVYSAAIRMVRDAHLAEDVTQGVFLALAQNAAQLADRAVLSGWLHRTAQNLAANAVRAEVRRRARESEAAIMNELSATTPDAGWEQIAPELDAALGELNEPDRDALLLRYFERKSAPEMARILGLTDEAAQKRVSRAVERLRDYFSRRKVTIGASGLAAVLSVNALQAAPAGLAAAIATTTASLALPSASAATIITTTKIIAMTTLQKIVVAATLAVVAGAGLYETHQAAHWRAQNEALRQQQAPLAEQVRSLQQERDDATNQLAGLAAELARIKSNQLELLKLRNETTQLRHETAAIAASNAAKDPAQRADEAWLDRVRLLKERLAQTPEAKNPEMQYLTEDNWMQAAKHKLDTDMDYRLAFSELRANGEGSFLQLAATALQKFLGTNNGVFPTEMAALKPYFDTPPPDEVLDRYHVVLASTVPQADISAAPGSYLITLKTPDSGSLWALSPNGVSGTSNDDAMAVLAPALKALMADTPTINGSKHVQMQDIQPYLTTPEEKAAYDKLMHHNHPGSP